MHDLVIRGGTVVIPSAPFAGSCSGRSPNLNKMHMQEIARCAWTERRENVIALGPSGTGKNYVALALGLGLAAWRIFMALGLGFLFIEIAFIQRFILFLGHLLYAVAVVLAGF